MENERWLNVVSTSPKSPKEIDEHVVMLYIQAEEHQIYLLLPCSKSSNVPISD
jgi:hypothetical protein